jgi:hypothetical protein
VLEFDGTSATRFSNALAYADLLVIPELETGDLFMALDPSAITTITDFVNLGGVIIVHASGGEPPILNDLFGLSLPIPTFNKSATPSMIQPDSGWLDIQNRPVLEAVPGPSALAGSMAALLTVAALRNRKRS